MLSFEKVPDLAEKMERVNQKIDQLLRTNDPLMSEVIGWILQNRGKQLRPAMMLLAASFGDWNERIIELAAVLEIIHTASLIHDDIVDDAQMRRSNESVQSKYGKNVAVYAGDFMIFSVFANLSFIPTKRMIGYFRSLSNLCHGELLQYENLHNQSLTVEDYLKRIDGKTGTLFRMACRIGAVESGCKAKLVRVLENYGQLFGYMFQIQDDLIDFLGVANAGKATHSDLREGIYSLPVIFALQDSFVTHPLKDLLIKYKSNPSISTQDSIYKIIQKTNSIEKTINLMETYRVDIKRMLALLPDRAGKDILTFMPDILYSSVQTALCKYQAVLQ